MKYIEMNVPFICITLRSQPKIKLLKKYYTSQAIHLISIPWQTIISRAGDNKCKCKCGSLFLHSCIFVSRQHLFWAALECAHTVAFLHSSTHTNHLHGKLNSLFTLWIFHFMFVCFFSFCIIQE